MGPLHAVNGCTKDQPTRNACADVDRLQERDCQRLAGRRGKSLLLAFAEAASALELQQHIRPFFH